MLDTQIRKEYDRWVSLADADREVAAELLAIADCEEKIEDAFYRDLAFGTGGLRGVIGAGTNRMNVYTVAKASQGLADYINRKFPKDARRIAVSYDSRIKSDLFAKVSSAVFAANGISVCIYPELMPTPCLSFAVRKLHCAAGIMVTASHNPSKYNGYKVYGADGCQITTEAAKEILGEIEKLDIFADVRLGDYEESVNAGTITYIGEDVYTAFVEAVKNQSPLGAKAAGIDKNVAIVYTPLNGTGLKPVLRTLRESGYSNISVVPQQEQPDGNFPTCPYPNPEIREAMALGMEYAKKKNADLLLATDPDCDRVGIAVKDELGLKGARGEYALLSGNETGILLLDYICSRRLEEHTMPEDPVMVKTIVTSDMAKQVADHYRVRTIDVLTGFKFIGEQIGLLEAQGKADSYIFGMEESYGYLSGSYVRDKDAVDGAFLICEMFAYYKTRGINLLEKLDELYKTYGYRLNTLHSYAFEGSAGMEKMKEIMSKFRGEGMCSLKAAPGGGAFGGKKIATCLDYAAGIDGLPKSDVLKFLLADNCSVVVRPSGTEPKLKLYISVTGSDMDAAEQLEQKIVTDLEILVEGK
jgi:phosphoglucomutase